MLKSIAEIETRGKWTPNRFADYIVPKKKKKEEEPKETAEDVIARITNSLKSMGK